MRTPRFWYGPIGLWAVTLSPLGWIYNALTQRRVKYIPDVKADVPVICVGNINAGGTGKTPTCIAIAQLVLARGITPIFVTRGHGGTIKGPHVVEPTKDTADQVGDEALLLAAFAQTIVATDRGAGAQAATDLGADVIILDDGFQNPTVHKDMSIVVVDAHRGFGNGLCIPAGPLREAVSSGMARADLVVSIGPDASQDRFAKRWGDDVTVQRIKGALVPLQTGMTWTGLRVIAFAGIGLPEKFFATLRALGVAVVGEHALGDHQPLSDALLGRLSRDAAAQNAQLITTEKDAVRLPASLRSQILVLPVRLEFDDPTELEKHLDLLGV